MVIPTMVGPIGPVERAVTAPTLEIELQAGD
jgi:hypothetical protein